MAKGNLSSIYCSLFKKFDTNIVFSIFCTIDKTSIDTVFNFFVLFFNDDLIVQQ